MSTYRPSSTRNSTDRVVGLPDDLTRRLSLLARRIRTLRLVRGIAWTFSVLAVGLLGAACLDWVFTLSATSRVVALSGVLLASIGVFVMLVVKPLRERQSLDVLAGVVESSRPELAERLMSTVELNASDDPETIRGSSYMRRRLTEETLQAVRGVNFPAAVTPVNARRAALIGAGALVFLMAPWLVAPKASRLLAHRMLNPYGNHASVGRLLFEIPDANRVVPTGSDVEIVALPQFRVGTGDVPEEVWVVASDQEGQSSRRRMEFLPDDQRFTAVLPHVMRSFDYRVVSDEAHSPLFRIEVVDAPQIVAARMEIEPPAYAGLPAETRDHVTGDIKVLQHSEVTIQLELNKPVAAANWLWLDGFGNLTAAAAERDAPEAEVSEDGRHVGFRWTAMRGGRFAFALTDSLGLSNPEEPRRQFLVAHDAPPRLTVEAALDVDVQPQDRFPVTVSVSDDIAVGAVELHVERDGEALPPVSVDVEKLGRVTVEHEFTIDLMDLQVEPGTIVSFRIRAADERPVPGPNEVWSERRSLRVVEDASPLGTSELLAEHQQIRARLKALQEALKANREKAEVSHGEAAAAAAAGEPFENDAELDTLSERQVELARQADDLRTRLAEHPLFAEFADAAADVARQHLPSASESVQDAARSELVDKPELIEEAVEQLRQAEAKLSGIDKQFDQLAELERDLLQLERLAQQARRLAETAEALDERRDALESIDDRLEREAAEAQLALDELRLRQQQTELSAQLDELLQRRPEVLEAARQQYLEALTELADQSRALAAPQQNLAEAFERQAAAREQTEPSAQEHQSPRAEEQAAPSESDAQPADAQPADAQPADAQPAGAQPADTQPDGAPAESAAGSGEPDVQNPNPGAESRSADGLAQQQKELAERAAAQALETAREFGPASASATRSREAAERAAEAARSAEFGQLDQGSEAATAAAEAARDAATQIASEPGASEGLVPDSEALAQQQEKLAAEMQQAAASPQRRAAAQQSGQQQLAHAAGQLAQQFSEAAERLGQSPIDLPGEGQQAQSAGEAARQAESAMHKALQSVARGDFGSGQQAARRAGEQLEAAAQAAERGAGSPPDQPSPVPGNVGQMVTDAARYLQQAAQGLGSEAEQTGRPNENPESGETSENNESGETGAPGTPGDPNAAQNAGQADDGEPADAAQQGDAADNSDAGTPADQGAGEASGQPSGDSGQGKPGNSPPEGADPLKQALEQAADALANAAQQLQPGQQPGRSNGRRSESQSASDGTPRERADVPVDLSELRSQLERLSSRDWGRLPGHLQTEILDAARGADNSDYARLIKSYFESIADVNPDADDDSKTSD